jgi:hypothetical protein
MIPQKETPPAATGGASECSLRSGENVLGDNPNPAPIQAVRLKHLAAQLHELGPAALGYFLMDLERGKPLLKTLESYARLEPLADFIREHAIAPALFTIPGGAAS